MSLDAWQRIGLALDRPLRIELARDAREEPADAGHLAIQELVMRVGRGAGFQRTFELPTRAASPTHSTDVGLRDDRGRRLILVECWNTIGDLGAAVRSTNRKRAEAEDLAAVLGGARPRDPSGDLDEPGEAYAVATVWVVRATRRNRDLVARYPELFASRFTGLEPRLGAGAHHRLSPAPRPWSGLVRCARHPPVRLAACLGTSACGRSRRGRA